MTVARPTSPTALSWALASALVSVAWVLLYLSVLGGESDERSARSVFVALFVLGTGAAVLVGPFLQHPLPKMALPSAAITGQFAWAVLGILSVGLPLLLAAVFSSVVAKRNAGGAGAFMGAAIGVLGSLAIFTIGLALTAGTP